MKAIIFVVLCLVSAGKAATGYRAFTTADGRVLEARITDFNAVLDRVTLERADGKSVTVSPTVFCEEDRHYMLRWHQAEIFQSDKLEVHADDERLREWEEEIARGSRGGGGGRGGGDDRSTPVRNNEEYGYNLLFKNKSRTDLPELTAEYRIVYESEQPERPERGARGGGGSGPDDRPEPEMISQTHSKSGSLSLAGLPAGEESLLQTKSIILSERKGGRMETEDELIGIWIRMTMKGPGDQPIVRDITDPEGLAKEYTWEKLQAFSEKPADAPRSRRPQG